MSEYGGQLYSVKAARKEHWCMWCGQKIEIGQPYKHWLWYCDGSRDTVKAHPECVDYANSSSEPWDDIRYDGDHHRPEGEAKS